MDALLTLLTLLTLRLLVPLSVTLLIGSLLQRYDEWGRAAR